MTNQVYNIIADSDTVKIEKNHQLIYTISVNEKSINLKELYDNMHVDINDTYLFVAGLNKIDNPKNDTDRIFNNTYDFISSLLSNLNNKLKELRERQDNSIFK